MKRYGQMLVIASVAMLLALASTARADDQEGVKALAGKWTFIAETFDGEEVPKDVASKLSILFKADKGTMRGGLAKAGARWIPIVSQETYDVKLGMDDKVHTIELVQQGKKTITGIYKLEKDKLVLCLNFKDSTRPTAFESKPETGIAVITAEKSK